MDTSKKISNGINLLAAFAALYTLLFYLPRGWTDFTPPLIPWLIYMLLPYIVFGILSLKFQKKGASRERHILFVITAIGLLCITVFVYLLLANEYTIFYLKQFLVIVPLASVMALLLLFGIRSWLINRANKKAQNPDESNTELSDKDNLALSEPSSTNQNDIEDFRQWIFESMKRIPSELAEQKDLFVCFNHKGKKPPIYWCFNNWTEAILLANHLGPNQPLFAMHSFYGFFKSASSKKVHTISISKIYGDLVLKQHHAEPIFIGGNCQAVPIAEAIAHFLLPNTETAPVLISLEHQPFYSYPGRVAMLFGSRSDEYNPFLGDEDPIPNWKKKYASPSWAIINGEHGKYFFEPSVLELVAHLNSVIDEFSEAIQSRNKPLQIKDSKTVRRI